MYVSTVSRLQKCCLGLVVLMPCLGLHQSMWAERERQKKRSTHFYNPRSPLRNAPAPIHRFMLPPLTAPFPLTQCSARSAYSPLHCYHVVFDTRNRPIFLFSLLYFVNNIAINGWCNKNIWPVSYQCSINKEVCFILYSIIVRSLLLLSVFWIVSLESCPTTIKLQVQNFLFL